MRGSSSAYPGTPGSIECLQPPCVDSGPLIILLIFKKLRSASVWESEYRWEFAGVIHKIQPQFPSLFNKQSSQSIIKHRRKFFPPPFTLSEISESIRIFNIFARLHYKCEETASQHRRIWRIFILKNLHISFNPYPLTFSFECHHNVYCISVLYQPTFQFSVIFCCTLLGRNSI